MPPYLTLLIPPGCDPTWHPAPTYKVQKYYYYYYTLAIRRCAA